MGLAARTTRSRTCQQSHRTPNPALSRAGAIARAVENVSRDTVRRMDSRILGELGTGSVAKDIPERCLHLRCRGHPKAVPVIPCWPAKLTKLAVDHPNAPGLAPALVLIVPIMPATRKNKGLASCGALLYSRRSGRLLKQIAQAVANLGTRRRFCSRMMPRSRSKAGIANQ